MKRRALGLGALALVLYVALALVGPDTEPSRINEAYNPAVARLVKLRRDYVLGMPTVRADIVTTPMPISGGGGGGGTFSGGVVTTPLDFNASGAAFSHLAWNTVQTPDTLVMSLGTTSRNILFIEAGDEAFDFAHAAATNPTLFVHSAGQSTTQWTGITHNGTNAVLSWGLGVLILSGATQQIQFTDNNAVLGRDANSRVSLSAGNAVAAAGILLNASSAGNANFQQDLMPGLAKVLTESAATAFVQIAVAAGGNGSSGGLIIYTIEANDATDSQARSGMIPWAAVNVGGTETCTVGAPVVATTSTEVVAVTTGTLTNTFTCETTPTNGITISANAVSSLTQTRLDITYRVIKLAGTGVITPQ